MTRYGVGDSIRADLPDETDPDYARYHGRRGEIIEVLHDDAGKAAGDERDSTLYRVEFEDGEVADFRWRDLRPP